MRLGTIVSNHHRLSGYHLLASPNFVLDCVDDVGSRHIAGVLGLHYGATPLVQCVHHLLPHALLPEVIADPDGGGAGEGGVSVRH